MISRCDAPVRRPPPPERRVLDGFTLLEAAETELPDQATQAKLNDRDLVDTVPSDLTYFCNLQYLDVSDNHLRWEGLVPLASLEELRMACNGMTSLARVPAGSFQRLELLDLSYNAVAPASLAALTALPSLRELDLSSNALTHLPASVMVSILCAALARAYLVLTSSFSSFSSFPQCLGLLSNSIPHPRCATPQHPSAEVAAAGGAGAGGE